jgi:hypothetical protein
LYGNGRSVGQWKGKVQADKGITVINNPREPLWGRIKIDIKEDIAIGNEDNQQYLFWSVKDIAVDQDSNIYVLDMKNYRIQKFDRDGKYLLSIGKFGQGPGEFQLPTIIRLNNRTGNIYTKDNVSSIVVFNERGEYVDKLALRHIVRDFIVDQGGNIFAILEKSNEKELTAVHVLCRINPQGQVFEISNEFPYPLDMRRIGEGTFASSTGFEPGLYLARLDENKFVYGYSAEYELTVEDWSERVLFKIRRNLAPQSFTRVERDALGGTRDSRSTLLEHKPYFFKIMCDSRGRIYVQRNSSKKIIPGKGAVEISAKEVDVFSKNGRFLYEAQLPANTFVIKDGFLFVYESNEETGLETIKRFRINNWAQLKE